MNENYGKIYGSQEFTSHTRHSPKHAPSHVSLVTWVLGPKFVLRLQLGKLRSAQRGAGTCVPRSKKHKESDCRVPPICPMDTPDLAGLFFDGFHGAFDRAEQRLDLIGCLLQKEAGHKLVHVAPTFVHLRASGESLDVSWLRTGHTWWGPALPPEPWKLQGIPSRVPTSRDQTWSSGFIPSPESSRTILHLTHW